MEVEETVSSTSRTRWQRDLYFSRYPRKAITFIAEQIITFVICHSASCGTSITLFSSTRIFPFHSAQEKCHCAHSINAQKSRRMHAIKCHSHNGIQRRNFDSRPRNSIVHNVSLLTNVFNVIRRVQRQNNLPAYCAIGKKRTCLVVMDEWHFENWIFYLHFAVCLLDRKVDSSWFTRFVCSIVRFRKETSMLFNWFLGTCRKRFRLMKSTHALSSITTAREKSLRLHRSGEWATSERSRPSARKRNTQTQPFSSVFLLFFTFGFLPLIMCLASLDRNRDNWFRFFKGTLWNLHSAKTYHFTLSEARRCVDASKWMREKWLSGQPKSYKRHTLVYGKLKVKFVSFRFYYSLKMRRRKSASRDSCNRFFIYKKIRIHQRSVKLGPKSSENVKKFIYVSVGPKWMNCFADCEKKSTQWSRV